MPQDFYFEVCRGKTHIYLDTKATACVLDLKFMLEGILKRRTHDFELWGTKEDGTRFLLQDNLTLAESGYTVSNAKPEAPAIIGLVIKGEDTGVDITPVSKPPQMNLPVEQPAAE
ncbi:unnamed protein product [Caenorhabditis bovis]|uniref:Ubiquitin-like domain-containing protein n=1 Tax=Caenorhabditis bovis TaxID=2654633 RepID=A0A8S1EN77_9PELO|nr:unnamed protein product [Caenorhabditis bovis]